jgi:hypothetical protein
MVGVAANFYDWGIEFITDATEIGVKLCFYGWEYQGLPMLRTEYEVQVIFY